GWREDVVARAAAHRVRLRQMKTFAASQRAFEKFVGDRIVRTSAETAFEERRNYIQRCECDHQPHRDAREVPDLDWLCRNTLLELTLKQQHGREQNDSQAKADERPRVIMIAEQRRAITGISRHDMEQ